MNVPVRKRIFLLVLTVVVVGLVIVFYRLDPTQHKWFPQCPFRLLTGWSCPACGLQRATHALLHGQVWKALSYNYFFFLSVPYCLAVVWASIMAKQGKMLRWVRWIEHPRLANAYCLLFLVWWVLRNVLHI